MFFHSLFILHFCTRSSLILIQQWKHIACDWKVYNLNGNLINAKHTFMPSSPGGPCANAQNGND